VINTNNAREIIPMKYIGRIMIFLPAKAGILRRNLSKPFSFIMKDIRGIFKKFLCLWGKYLIRTHVSRMYALQVQF